MARNKSRARIVQEMRIKNDRMRRELDNMDKLLGLLYGSGVFPDPTKNEETKELIAYVEDRPEVPDKIKRESLTRSMAGELLKVAEFDVLTAEQAPCVLPGTRRILRARVRVIVKNSVVSDKDCSS
ncbi:MAG: hypothetical protein E7579_04165 [Ruminococcaceae bacterium]|nr:hypothetical protein [Oscillospiraceae bacterium]